MFVNARSAATAEQTAKNVGISLTRSIRNWCVQMAIGNSSIAVTMHESVDMATGAFRCSKMCFVSTVFDIATKTRKQKHITEVRVRAKMVVKDFENTAHHISKDAVPSAMMMNELPKEEDAL
jgi:hypothetical protein